jgi:hypothetical protein
MRNIIKRIASTLIGIIIVILFICIGGDALSFISEYCKKNERFVVSVMATSALIFVGFFIGKKLIK